MSVASSGVAALLGNKNAGFEPGAYPWIGQNMESKSYIRMSLI